MNLSTQYGILGGFVLIAYLTALYFVDKTLLVEGWEKITWLLLLGTMLAAAAKRRLQEPDTFISFRPLMQTVVKVFLLAYFMKFAFIYILFRYGDPEMMEMVRMAELQLILENKPADVPDTIFAQQIKAYEQGDFGPRLWDIGLMLELILGFGMSAVTASIIRRDTPQYD